MSITGDVITSTNWHSIIECIYIYICLYISGPHVSHTSATLGRGCEELTMHTCIMHYYMKFSASCDRNSDHPEYPVGKFSKRMPQGPRKNECLGLRI